MKRLGKVILIVLAAGVVVALGLWVSMQFTPRPAALAVRWVFDRGAAAASAALVKHVPSDVMAKTDLVYDAASPNGKLDVYFPAAADKRRPVTVVWVHGGGFISGRKEDIGNYGRVLAGRGYTVVSVDYTIAPEAQYPTPLHQVNAALGWLARRPEGLPITADRLVLAGDSAGAQIVAQLANIITVPDYARAVGVTPAIERRHLGGLLLYCGVFGLDGISLDGPFGGFLRTALWSYFGRKDFLADPRLGHFSVPRHVTKDFPPVFITGGNADPLLPQSHLFARVLKERGVRVDELFFPDDYRPALGHEYQFNLDQEAGRIALERTVTFLSAL